jgi:ABC-2 type transport system ATP-binding protein
VARSSDHLAVSDSKPLEKESHLLVAENLRKSYGDNQALKGLSFSLKPGRILGFLGPNGAGKTTAIRILTTVLKPSSGGFSVDGIGHDEPTRIRKVIGVLPESQGLIEGMTGAETLTYFGRLYGQRASEARRRAADLLREVGLENRANTLVSTYSRGMRQRLGIARALINEPALLFLDEPTLGLDPKGQRGLLMLLKAIARDHRTGIILCSHLLSEIEEVCDDVVILRSGGIVASGTVSDVLENARHNNVQLRIPADFIEQATETLRSVPGVRQVSRRGTTESLYRLDVELEDVPGRQEKARLRNGMLSALIGARIPILNYDAAGVSLQDVFLQLTDEEQVEA